MNLLVKVAVAAAAAGVTGLAAAGCAGRAAAPPRGSVQACTAFGVRAIDEHRTVTQVPAACRGLSRAQVNFALGRSIYLAAGSGHHKVAWRRDAAVAGARLARLITTALAQSPGAPGPSAGRGGAGAGARTGPVGRAGPVDRRPLGLATLAAWLLTVGSGGYLLLRFVAGGGLRRQRAAGDRTGPAVVLTHFGLASTGLLLWAGYLASGWLALSWVAVALLLPVIGFGMATLIVWTSGPSRSRSGAPAQRSRTSGSPSRTSGAPSGTSLASAQPSPPSGGPSAVSEPSLPGTEPSLAGTELSPAGARSPVSPAGAPGQLQVAEMRDQEPIGQATQAPQTASGRRPSRWLTVVIPIVHGLLASTTILLALLTALGAT